MNEFDVIAEYYDLLYAEREDDLDLWLSLAEKFGEPILEIGCGTGRLLLPLAEAGYRICGIDLSELALSAARARLEGAGLSRQAEVFLADMRDFSLRRKRFHLAFIPINTFMHCLDTEEQLACLRSIHNHLAVGGRLVVDNYNPSPSLLLDLDGRTHLERELDDEMTGRRVQWFTSQKGDIALQTNQVTYILDEIGDDGTVRRASFSFRMRYAFRYELELLLQAAGFDLQECYGDYDQSPFTAESPRLIAVAQKRD
jgi:SAM-dependent methyltransferase